MQPKTNWGYWTTLLVLISTFQSPHCPNGGKRFDQNRLVTNADFKNQTKGKPHAFSRLIRNDQHNGRNEDESIEKIRALQYIYSISHSRGSCGWLRTRQLAAQLETRSAQKERGLPQWPQSKRALQGGQHSSLHCRSWQCKHLRDVVHTSAY